MIEIKDNGNGNSQLHIKGTRADLCSELSMIVNDLKDKMTKEEIEVAVQVGLTDDEKEREKIIEESTEKVMLAIMKKFAEQKESGEND